MKAGRLDGVIASLIEGTKNLREASATGEFSTDDGRLQAELLLSDTGERVWADVLMLGASGGGAIRLPQDGDTGLVALCDGDLNRAYLLGWFANGEAPTIGEQAFHLEPKPGEHVIIRTTAAGTVKVESSAKVEVTSPQVIVASSDIRLGSEAASDPVALQSKVTAKDTARDGQFAIHTHLVTVPLIPLAVAPCAPPLPSILGTQPVGATKVKGE